MEPQFIKRQRVDLVGRSSVTPYPGSSAVPNGPASHLSREDVHRVINTSGGEFFKQIVVDLVLGLTTQESVQHSVLRAHSDYHFLQYAQAVEEARLNRVRIQREKRTVVNFDHHVRQIEKWLTDEPRTNRWSVETEDRYNKIVGRLEKIRDKGTSLHTNYQTRVNALEALLQIASTVEISHDDNTIAALMIDNWIMEHRIGDVMWDVLTSMSDEERRQLRDSPAHETAFNRGNLLELIEAGKDLYRRGGISISRHVWDPTVRVGTKRQS
jgi:hypothetical protein